MTGHLFLHPLRSASGALLATVRYVNLGHDSARFEWLDAAGALVLAAEVDGPGATRIFDAAGREVLPAAGSREGSPAEPTIRVLGSSAVMRSCQVAGRPAWIIDDYANQSRHFVCGCAPDRFLHVQVDACGTVTVTEKTGGHATLRTVRRAATGALLADEALVQPGEDLDEVARRCGQTTDALLAANAALSVGSAAAAGTLVRLA
jgi:hypothetical protein